VPELDVFRELCNFSDDELAYFNFKAKHKSNTYIAMEMNVSEPQVSKLAKRVRNKIIRVLPYIEI
jgi:DNA-directed RNA polymerase specialized sigma subunit